MALPTPSSCAAWSSGSWVTPCERVHLMPNQLIETLTEADHVLAVARHIGLVNGEAGGAVRDLVAGLDQAVEIGPQGVVARLAPADALARLAHAMEGEQIVDVLRRRLVEASGEHTAVEFAVESLHWFPRASVRLARPRPRRPSLRGRFRPGQQGCRQSVSAAVG